MINLTDDLNALLYDICDEFHHSPVAKTPWIVYLGNTRYAAATNQARVLYLEDARREIEAPYAPRSISEFLADIPDPTHTVDRADIARVIGAGSVKCPTCNGSEELDVPTTCETCGGYGDLECNFGHHHECPDCAGLGLISHPCHGPGPHFQCLIDIARVRVGRLSVDARLMRGVFERLPGDVLFSSASDRACFHGPGWIFCVSPLRGREKPVGEIPISSINCEESK